jgi:hypothetical protein
MLKEGLRQSMPLTENGISKNLSPLSEKLTGFLGKRSIGKFGHTSMCFRAPNVLTHFNSTNLRTVGIIQNTREARHQWGLQGELYLSTNAVDRRKTYTK